MSDFDSDSDIIEWIEDNTTLHKQVECVYVVDGYEVSITYDDSIIKGPYFGDTLREAYYKAIKQSGD